MATEAKLTPSEFTENGNGFKFYKRLNGSSGFRRFWRQHISDAFSGEVHVDKSDQERVFKMLAGRGVSMNT